MVWAFIALTPLTQEMLYFYTLNCFLWIFIGKVKKQKLSVFFVFFYHSMTFNYFWQIPTFSQLKCLCCPKSKSCGWQHDRWSHNRLTMFYACLNQMDCVSVKASWDMKLRLWSFSTSLLPLSSGCWFRANINYLPQHLAFSRCSRF